MRFCILRRLAISVIVVQSSSMVQSSSSLAELSKVLLEPREANCLGAGAGESFIPESVDAKFEESGPWDELPGTEAGHRAAGSEDRTTGTGAIATGCRTEQRGCCCDLEDDGTE